MDELCILKQDQGSTALPFYIFLDVPDWIGAVEDTGLGDSLTRTYMHGL